MSLVENEVEEQEKQTTRKKPEITPWTFNQKEEESQ